MPKSSTKKNKNVPGRPLLGSVMRRFFGFFTDDLPVSEYRGEHKPNTEVAEVKHFQPVIEDICGGRAPKSVKIPCTALLRPGATETQRTVEISGREVGSLKPADAKYLHRLLSKADIGPCSLKVNALIEGGKRKKNGDTEDFTIKLALPPRPAKKKQVEAESSSPQEEPA
jgi:hypothetical protein